MVCKLSEGGSRQGTMGRVTLKVADVNASATREGVGWTTGGTRTTSGVCSVGVCSIGSGQLLVHYLLLQMIMKQWAVAQQFLVVVWHLPLQNNCLQEHQSSWRGHGQHPEKRCPGCHVVGSCIYFPAQAYEH